MSSKSSPKSQSRLVTVFGGTGFVGHILVPQLLQAGYRVRLAASRKPRHLEDGVTFTRADIRNPQQVAEAVTDAWAVINLVGIFTERRGLTFEAIHHQGAATLAHAATEAGVQRMVHLSALRASTRSPSNYARTKALGENAIRKFFPEATILRPSLIGGEGNDFASRFRLIARTMPILILPGMGKAKFQPVDVHDVTATILESLTNKSLLGQTADLAGPQVRTLRSLVREVLSDHKHAKLLLPLPLWACYPFALLTEIVDAITFGRLLPDAFILTRDQLRLLKTDNVLQN